VVLGGLVTDSTVQATDKVPVLGDIPLFGRLFRHRTKQTTKRNLLIFLTPHIIRDEADFRRIFARKMEERREFIDHYTAFDYHEVQPDIDYDRTNGLLEEMNRALAGLEAQAAALAELEQQEVPEHVPRPPLGAEHDEMIEILPEASPSDGADAPIQTAAAAPAPELEEEAEPALQRSAPPPSTHGGDDASGGGVAGPVESLDGDGVGAGG